MALELRWFALPSLYLGGSYALYPSRSADAQSASIALTRHPMELGFGYEEGAWLSPTVEVSALLDVIHRSTLSAGADYERTPDQSQVLLGVGLRGGVSWGPVDWVRVSVRAGADLAARRVSFVSRRDVAETVVETSLISPKFLVGLAAHLP
jgi:hypothetical protein